MLWQAIRTSDLDRTKQRTGDLLERDCKNRGEDVGWHQFIGDERIGPTATAQALICYSLLGMQHPDLDAIVSYLRGAQWADPTEPLVDGGWTIGCVADRPVTDATAWTLLGLFAAGQSVRSRSVQAGIRWLVRNQNDDGGWASVRGLRSRTYHTAMAVRALALLGVRNDAVQAGYEWLLRNRRSGSGWGQAPARSPTPEHTAQALIALRCCGMDRTASACRQAIQWLYQRWDSKAMWEHDHSYEQYDVPLLQGGGPRRRVIFHHFPTAWTIFGLLRCGESILNPKIFEAFKWLLHTQQGDGSWFCSSVQRSTLWAVHDSLSAIQAFSTCALESENIDRVVLLDDVVVLVGAEGRGSGLRRLLVAIGLALAGLGCIAGIGVASITHAEQWLFPILIGYWSWITLALFLAGAMAAWRLRLISLREALLSLIFPALLILLQVYMERSR